tara:strand:+ start:3374 stop:3571 length:198 start_codon:yes stop_codon:yes gene_type:complete
MSTKLKEIFQSHQDKDIQVSFGNQRISEKVMSESKFIWIVTKLLKQESNGKKHTDIAELHKYLDV